MHVFSMSTEEKLEKMHVIGTPKGENLRMVMSLEYEFMVALVFAQDRCEISCSYVLARLCQSAFAYDPTTFKAPHTVRSAKLRDVGHGQYLDGGSPGNTRCRR